MFHHSYHNENLGLDSFKERNKVWHNNPLVEDFSRWTAESFVLTLLRFQSSRLTLLNFRGTT
jgi:hypothetical protein